MTRYNPVDDNEALRRQYKDIRSRGIVLARSKNFLGSASDDRAANAWFNGIVNQAMTEMGITEPTAMNYVITAKKVVIGLREEPSREPGDTSPLVLRFGRPAAMVRGPEEVWEYTGARAPIGGRWIIGSGSVKYGYPSREAAEAVVASRRAKRAAQEQAVERVLGHKGRDVPRWGLSIGTAKKAEREKYEQPLYADIYRDRDTSYTYPDVLRLLDRADNQTFPLVEGLIRAMMDRQTVDEQTAEDALYSNKSGFSKPDAAIAARLLKELEAVNTLNPSEQLSLHYRISEFLRTYARRQLPDVLQQHGDHFGYALRTNRGRKSRRNPQPVDLRWYQAIMAMLRAIQWKSWTLHWQVSGSNYYGDHLLLQRMYQGEGGGPVIDDSIDALGERMVAYFGPESVDAESLSNQTSAILRETAPGFAGLLDLEMRLQKGIKAAWKMNQEAKDAFSLGMDDYLMGLSNERDTVIYLLKQRLRK